MCTLENLGEFTQKFPFGDFLNDADIKSSIIYGSIRSDLHSPSTIGAICYGDHHDLPAPPEIINFDVYSEGLKYSVTIDPLMKQIHQGGIRLTSREKSDLLTFLRTLTDEGFINNPELSTPF